MENSAPRMIRRDARLQPHLAGASAHFISIVVSGIIHRFKTAAELDQIAIAVLPFVKVIETLDNLVELRGGPQVRHGESHSLLARCALARGNLNPGPRVEFKRSRPAPDFRLG